ncbi:ParB/RepB/Spo0J family partition protein [Mycobacterium paraense]|uniref:ParB/RepB/Spo0J family partition protein n=1 Tax=Mycobacterium paraense TaxID=767916 RepID=UPI000A16B03A|nr:ParB/RepB/Spo0J family partition protein [Mycobacterium paraense]
MSEKKLTRIPLESLVIGRGQVRVTDVSRKIDELAHSIRVQGLLEPIVVCPSPDQEGKYEVLAGQRRMLACEKLGWTEIDAVVQDAPADDSVAKAISLTENLLRLDPARADKIDACTDLYRKYGSIKDVVARTGLPASEVREYVLFDRLAPELQEMVRSGVGVQVALRAQDAASVSGELDVEEAKKFAQEMSGMSGAQQLDILKKRQQQPDRDADDLIEGAKSGERIIQLNVQMSADAHTALSEFAKSEGTSIGDAARGLIESGLSSLGFGR